MAGAKPEEVSDHAKKRQQDEVGTLGSGNHYLEVQQVVKVFDLTVASAFGVREGDVVVSIHCGSRGLGHQIGTEFLKRMVTTTAGHALGTGFAKACDGPMGFVRAIREQMAYRDYNSGEYYYKRKCYGSARYYYNDILKRYPEATFEEINHSAPNVCDPNHEMIGILRANAKALGRPDPAPIVSLGGTDARLWRQRGIPALVHGPFPRGMAQADEHVEVEEFLHVVRMHVLSSFDYLSG